MLITVTRRVRQQSTTLGKLRRIHLQLTLVEDIRGHSVISRMLMLPKNKILSKASLEINLMRAKKEQQLLVQAPDNHIKDPNQILIWLTVHHTLLKSRI